jgi:hypothetical protein
MHFLCRIIRNSVTAGLIVGLAVAGLVPQTMGWAERDTRIAVSQQATKCCCGTEEGRCCGMGCCSAQQAPAKERCPCPNPKDSRDGHNNPLALALAKALLSDAGGTPRLRFAHPESQLDSAIEHSLQAKHIRIDA